MLQSAGPGARDKAESLTSGFLLPGPENRRWEGEGVAQTSYFFEKLNLPGAREARREPNLKNPFWACLPVKISVARQAFSGAY